MALIDFSSVGSGILNVALGLSIVLISSGIAWAVFAFAKYQKKYSEFDIEIWEKDGFGQFRQTKDKGGIFVDKKTNDKRLYLKKNRIGLDCNSIPYIPTEHRKFGKTIIRKTVYLLKTGSKNFKYIKPNAKDETLSFSVGEEDVNWGLQAYAKQKAVFGQNSLLQYLPYIALVVVAVIIMVIFIYFFKNFEVLRDVAIAFENAAAELAKHSGSSYNGTLIIS